MAAHRRVNDNANANTYLQDNESKGQAGRPRSAESRRAILDATKRLLMRSSLPALSIESIARKAGVGKTTIYRWWPHKAAIAMEAFLEQPGSQNVIPGTTDPVAAVTHQIESLIRQLRGQNGRIIAGIIAESQADATVLDLLYEKFLKERLDNLYRNIETGKTSGAFNPNLQTDIAIDMILGPLFLRVLSGEHGIDNHFAENYPAQAMLALRP